MVRVTSKKINIGDDKMINKVIIMGRITRELELKTTTGGSSYVKFSVAVDEGYGEHKKTDFIPCIAWGKTAEFVSKYFSKGKMIIIIGKITTASWTGQDGSTKYDTGVFVREVQFGEKKTNANNDDFVTLNHDDIDLPWEEK